MSCKLQTLCTLLCVCVICGAIQGQVIGIIVEDGHSTTLNCPLKSTGSPIFWVMVRAGLNTLVSTCQPGRSCDNNQAQQYTAQIHGSFGTYNSTLVIASARKDIVHFACSVGIQTTNFVLGVYVWPSTPTCNVSLHVQGEHVFADFTCQTEHVYPGITATVYRQEGVIKNADLNATECHVTGVLFSPMDDYTGSCNLRLPASELLQTNTLYVGMSAIVFNGTTVNRPPSISASQRLALDLPHAKIQSLFCPVGPGVDGGFIRVGTTATCRCELIQGSLIPGTARWYTKDGTVTGTEDPDGQFSTITVSYNYDGKYRNQSYECRAENPTATYYHFTYWPRFTYQVNKVIVESAASTTLECPLQSTGKPISWVIVNITGQYIPVSTCYPGRACNDTQAPKYTAWITNRYGTYTSTLEIASARRSESNFVCFVDAETADFSLGIYASASAEFTSGLFLLLFLNAVFIKFI